LFFSSVIATASLPPLVVLRSPGPIERPLLSQQVFVVHSHSLAPVEVLTHCEVAAGQVSMR
jgi:hypothetical protein